MRKKILIFSWLVSITFALAAIPNRIQGQTYRTFASELEDISTKARWKWGPFRISPFFQLAGIGYDSNVYYLSGTNELVSDFMGTVSLRVDISYIFRNWLIFTLSENPAYAYYSEQESQRYLNNLYSFNLKMLLFSRIGLTGSRRANRELSRWTGEVAAQTVHKSSETSGSIFYETPRRTSIGFTGRLREIKYESLLGEVDYPGVALSREEITGLAEFYYRVFSDSFFFINLGYSEYTFDYPQSRFRDSYSYDFSSGIRFPLLGRATGVLSLGYKRFNPRRSEMSGFSGLVGNTSVNIRLGLFVLRFNYAKDVSFSVSGNNIFYKANNYGLGISYDLNRFIRLDYSFRQGQNQYPEPTRVVWPDGSFAEIKRKDIFTIQSAAIIFKITEKTGIGLEGNFWNRNSNLPHIDLKKFFVGASLTYEF